MRIGVRLTAAFLVIAGLVGLVGSISGLTKRQVQRELERLSRSAIIKQVDTAEIIIELSRSHVAVQDLLCRRLTQSRDGQELLGDGRDEAELRDSVDEAWRSIRHRLQRTQQAAEGFARWAAENGEPATAEREERFTLPQLEQLSNELRAHRRHTDRLLALLEDDPAAAAAVLDARLHPHFHDTLLPLLANQRGLAESEFTRGVRTVQRELDTARRWQTFLALIAASGAVVLGLAIARSIARPLGQLRATAERLAEGRLESRSGLKSRDEIGVLGRAFDHMAAELQAKTVSREELQASLAEKELLLKEVHHRVKNNLQIISSLLNLQAQQTEDADVVRRLIESQGRIRAMALIHEQLYQSEDLARIDFAKYVDRLAHQLGSSLGTPAQGVAVRVEIDEIPVPLDLAIPCGMIVNELVTNAIEHAFPDGRGGEVRVDFARRDQRYELEVADTGIGMPAGAAERTGSLGLKVVDALVRQLQGKLEIESAEGTIVRVHFEREGPGP